VQHTPIRWTPAIRAVLWLRWPRAIAIAFCAVAGILLPAAYGMVAGVPQPLIHDEFAYLLGADTFVHGRLTNPPPSLPDFFEAPHIIVTPTYQSKYPPGQALVLAAGQVTMGHPIWGVWISCGLFAAALCWMLQAWTSKRWALAVTLMTAATLGTATYWAQSYWGGMLSATGGALVLGAVRRTLRGPRMSTSAVLAIGLVILANTRAYEGALLSVPAAFVLGTWVVRERSHIFTRNVLRLIVPMVVIMCTGFGLMFVYNRAVTGSFATTPYTLHQRQYFQRGMFVFSAPRVPERKPVARVANFYSAIDSSATERGALSTALSTFAIALPMSLSAPFGFVSAPSLNIPSYRGVIVWLILVIALWRPRSSRVVGVMIAGGLVAEYGIWSYLPAYPQTLAPVVVAAWLIAYEQIARRYAWARFVSLTLLFFALGEALIWWWYPHYSAPVTALVAAAIAASAQRLARQLSPGAVRHVLPLVGVVAAAEITVAYAMHDATSKHSSGANGTAISRSDVVRRLLALPGDDLVFVEYDEQFPRDLEWVYNGADLASSPVIFAHHQGSDRNAALIAVYPSRSVWQLRLSETAISLTAYSAAPRTRIIPGK
jgi:hypothetical protein